MDAALAKIHALGAPGDGDPYYAQPSAQQMMLLRAHPRFSETALKMASNASELKQGSGRMFNFIVNDRVRTQLAYFILYLYWSRRPGSLHPGLTASQIKAVFAELKLAGGGRVDALIAAMRLFGYLRIEDDPYDRRVKIIVPTEKHVTTHLRWIRTQFEAMSMVLEEGNAGLAALDRADFPPAFIRKICESRYHGFRIAKCVPEMDKFLTRNSGVLILLYLMVNSESAADKPTTRTTAISVSHIAKRFGVSRAHVREILAEAERIGFVERAGDDGGDAVLLEKWTDSFENLYAAVFLHFAACTRAALAEIGNS